MVNSKLKAKIAKLILDLYVSGHVQYSCYLIGPDGANRQARLKTKRDCSHIGLRQTDCEPVAKERQGLTQWKPENKAESQ